MIAAAFVALHALHALHLAAAQQSGPVLVVRAGPRVIHVTTVATTNGPMLRPEALDSLMPIKVTRDSASWYTIAVWGARLQLEIGSPLVRFDGGVRPLITAPVLRNGNLMIPLQLVSEVFPGSIPNVRWNAELSELWLFTSVAGTSSGWPTTAIRQASADVERAPRSMGGTSKGPLPPIQAKLAGHRMVIVDAGHGGVDNGMSGPIGGGPKIYEKNITLAVANRLGSVLRARGVDVLYTRTADTLISLDDRGRMANKAQGDLFISIHVNAANPNWKDPGGSRGFETYFLSEARTEDARRVEHMENDAARFESMEQAIDKDNPLSFIVSDMQQNEHLRESSELAALIQERLGEMHPGPSRGVKQAGFRVLVTAYMPSVLVEIGFGTNPREAQYLADPGQQQALASAIADAAMKYLERHADRVNGVRGGPSR